MNALELYRLRKSLSQYIPSDTLNTLLTSPSMEQDIQPLQHGAIEFVLVAVRAETPEAVAARMGEVADLAAQHNGSVDALVSSVVVIAYGLFGLDPKSQGNRLALVEALEQHFGDEVKIVHGRQDGCSGNLGNASRMSFSFIVPGFVESLGILANLSFGQTQTA